MWWRGLRSRPLVSVLLAALSAVAVATAVFGPLLVRAVEQSSLADTVAAAGAATSLTVRANGDASKDLGPVVSGTEAALSLVVVTPSRGLWGPVQQWTETTTNVTWQVDDASSHDTDEGFSRLRVADDCTGLTLTAGRCPLDSGETLVSTSDATQHGVEVGDTMSLQVIGVPETTRFSVVGLYDPTTVVTPLSRPGQEPPATAVATADPLVVVASQVQSLPLPTLVSARVVLQRPVDLADLPLLRAALAELDQGVRAQDLTLVVVTRLGEVLDRVSSQTTAAVVLVGVVEVQALGLALFAVVVVLSRVAGARGAEWGAGRLLGIPRPRWFRSVYVEPGAVLLLGGFVGYAAALVVASLAVRAALRPGTPVEPWRWPVLGSAAAAGLLLLLALVVVSLPSLRRPLAELVAERAEAVGTTPLAAAAQAVVVLSAVLTVYVLGAGDVLGGRGPQVGLLAPALLALALALVAVRLAVVLVRRQARRPARSLVGLVVARQAARTPSSLSPAVVVAVGVALMIFAGQVLALSIRNQDLKADAVTGAATVLTVAAPPGKDLITAVDRADPSGRHAMAVRERAALGATGDQRIVAVDTSRLTAVAAWSPGWAGVAEVASSLRPPTAAPVELRGGRLEVHVESVRVQPGEPLADGFAPAEPELSVTVDTGTGWRTVVLGKIAGRSRLSAAVPCDAGCRLVDIGLSSHAQQPYTAALRITGLGTDAEPVGPPADWLTEPGRWQPRVGGYFEPDPDAFAEADPGPAGLEVAFTDNDGGARPAVEPTDVLDPLPVLVGPRTDPEPYPGMDIAAFGTGLDGNGQLVRVVGRAEILPRALADGVLADLRSAQDLVDPRQDSSTAEVWLAPGAPPSVESSLEAAGFVVTGREQLADTSAALRHEPTTRGAAVAQVVARSTVVLTLLALVAARVADAPRRRIDWRSLADAGVRGRTLRRLATVEIAVPSVLGVALGAASGLVAVTLAARRLPVVDLTTPGPPLVVALDWPLALLTTVGSVVAVVAVAVLGAIAETRRVAVS